MKKITKFSVAFFIIYNFVFIIPQLVGAASPSPSPNKALTEFQQKVEDIKKDAASKAAELKKEVSQNIQNKAYFGKVLSINDKQLSLQGAKTTRTVNTDEYTNLQDNSKKGFTFKDIKKDDFLVALGDVDDKQVLKAKKIVRVKYQQPAEKSIVWGKVESILVSNLIVTKQDGTKVTVRTDGNTAIRLGNSEAVFSDIKSGNYVISVGSKLNNDSSNSQFIYILNPKGDLKSASASATPSASPKR